MKLSKKTQIIWNTQAHPSLHSQQSIIKDTVKGLSNHAQNIHSQCIKKKVGSAQVASRPRAIYLVGGRAKARDSVEYDASLPFPAFLQR
eukprot:4623667-Amphidinium_carterae.1